jgi:hypothetical protein
LLSTIDVIPASENPRTADGRPGPGRPSAAGSVDEQMLADYGPEARTFHLTPPFEGANIRMWIGFKHFVSLVEEAVYRHLAAGGHAPRDLFWERGIAVQITASRMRLRSVLMYGEDVCACVAPAPCAVPGALGFRVALAVLRLGVRWRVASADVVVAARDAAGTPYGLAGAGAAAATRAP